MIRINNDWQFVFSWTDGFGRGEGPAQKVRLPHTVKSVPLHYAGPEDYETVCGYRRALDIPAGWAGKRLFLQFDGAAHIATVYINGQEAVRHRCGYTSFRAEITGLVRPGEENLVSVKLDCTENPSVPPFGFVIDYLTYGGIYRDVWLDVRPQSIISDLFVYTPDLTTARVKSTAPGPVRYEIFDPDGALAGSAEGAGEVDIIIPNAQPWTLERPALYSCRATLLDGGDVRETTFGFRTAEFRADGFYLNGEKIFLRGLNRHQSFPYIGYAAPERLQREDARILKRELCCNAVRTSHYPQSHYFLDACDREGLLVFTELPGWQHIGDAAWKDQACENVREMVTQYRNHPSVILWGVRINESLDDDAFYQRTNAIARELDPSRATTGVRYLEKSHLLEDVYAFNDFSHTGGNAGARRKKDVCPDSERAFIISECNGHMYPTKPSDPWSNRQEQALRHARVFDAAMADGEHAGAFGWCMFDYPTHRDFGSGDRVCYHGVMDAFRNPKTAAAFFASQGEERPVLEVGSPLAIGDYPGGQIGRVYVFTNADEVELYKNGDHVSTLRPTGWKALPHGPIPVEDTIGRLLETKEGFPRAKADALRDCLLSAGKYGLANMPVGGKLKMAWCMVRYGMSLQDGYALYEKYVGNWGGSAISWRFDAKKNGKTVASVTRSPSVKLRLAVTVSHTELTEGEVYDAAAVRVRLLDEYGCTASYAPLPVRFALEGEASLAGPETAVLEGGMSGNYVLTSGRTGTARLTVSAPQTEPVTIIFTIRKEE